MIFLQKTICICISLLHFITIYKIRLNFTNFIAIYKVQIILLFTKFDIILQILLQFTKEIEFFHKLKFSNPYILAT